MLGRLGKPSPMFPPKKGEKGKELLGRLLLAIHWLTFFLTIIFILFSAIELTQGLIPLDTFLIAFLWFVVPAIMFPLIYWIAKNKWVFFPWQHVKREE